MNLNSLNFEIKTDGLSLNTVKVLYDRFFTNPWYKWWYEPLPEDVVVDVGACIGMFSCQALDAGADKVYMIEPNKDLLKVAIHNVSEYMFNMQDPIVIPINTAIGNTLEATSGVLTVPGAKADTKIKLITFDEFISTYKIDHIDFLKINASGSEYDILETKNLDYFTNNVRHIAVLAHIAAFPSSLEKFKAFRDEFLKPFRDAGKVKLQGSQSWEMIDDDDALSRAAATNGGMTDSFMFYITNY